LILREIGVEAVQWHFAGIFVHRNIYVAMQYIPTYLWQEQGRDGPAGLA
jgi:hypothetical protein